MWGRLGLTAAVVCVLVSHQRGTVGRSLRLSLHECVVDCGSIACPHPRCQGPGSSPGFPSWQVVVMVRVLGSLALRWVGFPVPGFGWPLSI